MSVISTPGNSICKALSTPRTSCCIRVPPDIVHYPDPATYDAALVFESGGAPTFNSPDINTIFLWPIIPLEVVTATVRNLSPDASAGQVRVDWSWSAWGIGLERQPIASTLVSLARAGFANSEATVTLALPPAVKAANRYGIFIDLVHPFDRDTTNNHGEQTLDGFQTSQGRSKSFVVPVRNPTSGTATIQLSAGPAAIASWVSVTPASFTLAPGAQENVTVAVTVPASVPTSPAGTLVSATVDVLATANGGFLGGIAVDILIDA
jgi:hypothetical protein